MYLWKYAGYSGCLSITIHAPLFLLLREPQFCLGFSVTPIIMCLGEDDHTAKFKVWD